MTGKHSFVFHNHWQCSLLGAIAVQLQYPLAFLHITLKTWPLDIWDRVKSHWYCSWPIMVTMRGCKLSVRFKGLISEVHMRGGTTCFASNLCPSEGFCINWLVDEYADSLSCHSALSPGLFLCIDCKVLLAVHISVPNHIGVHLTNLLFTSWLIYWKIVPGSRYSRNFRRFFLQVLIFWARLWGVGSGHQSFSNNRALNDLVGNITHASILVPYHGWRISHRTHHANHGHVENDESWHPVPKSIYDSMVRPCIYFAWRSPVAETVRNLDKD